MHDKELDLSQWWLPPYGMHSWWGSVPGLFPPNSLKTNKNIAFKRSLKLFLFMLYFDFVSVHCRPCGLFVRLVSDHFGLGGRRALVFIFQVCKRGGININ